jgi:hypothetical protein
MFAPSGDSRPKGVNDDVGGVLSEPSFSTIGWESTCVKLT